jgi:hypothetical protein
MAKVASVTRGLREPLYIVAAKAIAFRAAKQAIVASPHVAAAASAGSGDEKGANAGATKENVMRVIETVLLNLSQSPNLDALQFVCDPEDYTHAAAGSALCTQIVNGLKSFLDEPESVCRIVVCRRFDGAPAPAPVSYRFGRVKFVSRVFRGLLNIARR